MKVLTDVLNVVHWFISGLNRSPTVRQIGQSLNSPNTIVSTNWLC